VKLDAWQPRQFFSRAHSTTSFSVEGPNSWLKRAHRKLTYYQGSQAHETLLETSLELFSESGELRLQVGNLIAQLRNFFRQGLHAISGRFQ
jgi:hypothetical protein